MRDINALHPDLQEKISELLAVCEQSGLKIGICECLRTKAEQDALYAKGRTAPGSIVTNAKGSTYSSMHQWGVAFDFYRNDGSSAYKDADGFFTKVGKIGQSLGLEWGGDWEKPVDKPHFQLPYWGSTAKGLKSKYSIPENFMKEWYTPMTEKEKSKFNLLVMQVEKLTQQQERIYHYWMELPQWAMPTMQKLVERGFYKGKSDADLNLPENLMRVLVINDRAGLYD